MAEDLGLVRKTDWLDILAESDDETDEISYRIYFRKTKTEWKIEAILTEREFDDSITRKHDLYEASGICIAVQTKGPSKGSEAILRVRMQIPPDTSDDEDDDNTERSKFAKDKISWIADNEIDILEQLTEKGCSCTPKLLDYRITRQTKDQYVPGGYIAFILMEKLPGRNLNNFHTFTLEKRDEVRIAAARAIREFHSLGYLHLDPGRRNLIWDDETKRCFIIDLEDVEYVGKHTKFIPRAEFVYWELACQSRDSDPHEIDPMVSRGYEDAPDDESLRALASRPLKRKRAKI
ncbi:hypothetical protein DTO271G3_7161 [Paecilomyces variotii]|nr:hypothetical protein DTO271G3_7161 [Paecilomyces variotii]